MPEKQTQQFVVTGNNASALFTLKIYHGEGMALLAMNWKKGKPSADFVGFSIEYKEPKGDRFFALKNRITFPDAKGNVSEDSISSLQCPFQKFRWIHFARNAELEGDFIYKVKPAFMNDKDEISFGEAQEAAIQLSRITYPDKMNITFTRGFVLSQAFADRYEADGGIPALIPADSKDGLTFKPTHPKAQEALEWMGFEARNAILEVLDKAIADKKAEVRVVAYDLCEPEVVSRLEKLGDRLKIIIDDKDAHGEADSGETQSQQILEQSAGNDNVKRHHMSGLQHNKTIIVNGPKIKAAVCGSTNHSWRGFYVQANNAVILYGAEAIQPFIKAFDNYWKFDSVKGFGITDSAEWTDLGFSDITAKVAFSPHSSGNALLNEIAHDIENNVQSNMFYSLAFLYQTPGPILDAINKVISDDKLFVYGISDKKVGGIELQKPDGNILPVYPSELSKNLPKPFKSESKGGRGNRMHHKFVVIDFDKPSARVYLGSYNFSSPADIKNGENLLLIEDQKIVVAYMIEAVRIFDHYHFRITQKEAKKANKKLALAKPPRKNGEVAWWNEYYKDKRKIRDRELFA
ncbi:MAG: phospholipase [Ignavibacteria bacterium]|nr:phospholipase [Ignavibacteria bacterium]